MITVSNLNNWLSDVLQHVTCTRDTNSYITSVLSNKNIVEKNSVVLAFYNARLSGSFVSFQEIGDWVLFKHSIFECDDRDVQLTVARLSYYSCYRLTKYTWPLYEELADQLPAFTKQIRKTLHDEDVQNKRICYDINSH